MNRIRERRLELGLTQPQLAEKLREADRSIDVGMVSRFEQSVCLPTEEVMKSLETALQATRTDLYDDIELFYLPTEKTANSPFTEDVAKLIPFGKEKAVTREYLSEALGLGDRAIRRAISKARADGVIIINEQNGNGYYRSDDIDDIEKAYRQEKRRALSTMVGLKRMRRILKEAGRPV